MAPQTTTTTMKAAGGGTIGECTFWGDPHIESFDGGRPSFYGNGEMWIVKSEQIWIQGRYLGTSWTHGLAATSKIVVGGPFLQGHHIEVGTMDSDELEVDGQAVLGSIGSSYSIPGLAHLTYSDQGELVDKAQTEYPKRIVHMDLPMGLKIDVMRWPNYLDLRIVMPSQGNMDGSCGNFNGDPSDDTTEAIIQRLGDKIETSDFLFDRLAPQTISDEMKAMLEHECTGLKRQEAKSACQHLQYTEACEYDVCFGMNAHARKQALTYAENTE